MGRKRSEPNEQPEPVEGAAEETIADEATPDAAAADETSETADAAVDEVQPEAESAPAEEAAEPVEAAADEQAAARS